MNKGIFRKKTIESILAESQQIEATTGHQLKKVLGVKDLTGLGVAAIIGAGIFTSIGKASYEGGPAVVFLYLFTALACGFAALCYAEFASKIPVSGSAYTYSYVAFGELFAWVIGWCLIMEYSIGNIAVAISWSDYLTNVLNKTPFAIPDWLAMDYWTAKKGYAAAMLDSNLLNDTSILEKYTAFTQAPAIGNFKFIVDFPAFLITAIITAIVFVGIRESKKANNILVLIKLAVVFLVIVAGSFYIDPDNWSPFAPNGVAGVLKGVSAVFFAYIGFDAISTTAEECKNPQRDLPRAMLYSLIICAVLYVVVALVLTGMLHYSELNVGDPLALVFDKNGMTAISAIVALSAIVATASVLLVFQIGQPRIWMTMGRDGLLPQKFASLHPKYGTPAFATIVTGLLVGLPALFLNLDLVLALTSIGTLFAFVLVCGGILMMHQRKEQAPGKFKVPYINSKWILPVLFLGSWILICLYAPNHVSFLTSIDGIPMLIFWLVATALTIAGFIKNFSLIPVLGLVSCFYLMAQEHVSNWTSFAVWLVVGLIIYFAYGYRKSKLAPQK